MSDKKFILKEIKKNSHIAQSKWSIANYLRLGVLNFFQKQRDYSYSRGDGGN